MLDYNFIIKWILDKNSGTYNQKSSQVARLLILGKYYGNKRRII
jgi:hypothetical protein